MDCYHHVIGLLNGKVCLERPFNYGLFLRLLVPRDGTKEHTGLEKKASLRSTFSRARCNFTRPDQVRALNGLLKLKLSYLIKIT